MVFSGLNFTSLYMLLAIKPPMSKLAALYNGESIHTGIKFLSFVALFIGWSKSLELLIDVIRKMSINTQLSNIY